MHPDATAPRRLVLKRQWDVSRELGGIHRVNIAVGTVDLESTTTLSTSRSTDLPVRNAVHEAIVSAGDRGDGISDRPGSLIEKRQRIQQTGGGVLADVVGDAL